MLACLYPPSYYPLWHISLSLVLPLPKSAMFPPNLGSPSLLPNLVLSCHYPSWVSFVITTSRCLLSWSDFVSCFYMVWVPIVIIWSGSFFSWNYLYLRSPFRHPSIHPSIAHTAYPSTAGNNLDGCQWSTGHTPNQINLETPMRLHCMSLKTALPKHGAPRIANL